MLSLHTHIAVLHIQPRLAQAQSELATTTTRLGSGHRINSAKDDAAGLQIAMRLDAQTKGMQVAIRNTQHALSLLQTADGAFDELTRILLRMKDLATQAADGASAGADRAAMQSEYDALGSELKHIVADTSYGGDPMLAQAGARDMPDDDKPPATWSEVLAGILQRMRELARQASDYALTDAQRAALWAQHDALRAEFEHTLTDAIQSGNPWVTRPGATWTAGGGKLSGAITFQIGAASADTMTLDVSKQLQAADTSLKALSAMYAGTAAAGGGEVSTAADAGVQIDKINSALASLGAMRSAIGAAENRLEHTRNNLITMTGNTTDARGRIMDTDYAAESAALASQQIVVRAGTAMLKQAASMGRLVLVLLR